jgi:hypothetical protein
MSTAKGGRVNPINPSANRNYQDTVKILNRLQPIQQLKQTVGAGSYLVSKRMTTGTIIATRSANGGRPGGWPLASSM